MTDQVQHLEARIQYLETELAKAQTQVQDKHRDNVALWNLIKQISETNHMLASKLESER